MKAGDVLTLLRQMLSDTSSTSGRWKDPTLLNFIDRANKRVVHDVLFPDSRIFTSTQINVQEYPIPWLLLKVYAIYVAGQLIIPSDLPTLEGRQIGVYSSDFNPAALVTVGSGAPPGTQGPMAPRWMTQTPLTYPVDGIRTCPPAPDTQPWWCGQRPRYYWRGGSLGIVPSPANTVPVIITIDCVRQPDTITSADDEMTTPENFMDTIVEDALRRAKYGDDGSRSERQMTIAQQNYLERVKDLRLWRGEFPGEQRDGPKVITQRSLTKGRYTVRRNR
jgi:hypothetical protein